MTLSAGVSVQLVSLSAAADALAALLDSDPGNLIYGHADFLAFLVEATSSEARVALANVGGGVVGAMPFLTRDCPGVGRVINSLPWYGSHGGCILDRSRNDADAIRRALLGAFRAHADAPDVLSATVVLPHAEEPHRVLYAEVLQPAAQEHRIGQITALNDPNSLLDSFEKKTRNQVRKSLKQGFVESVNDDDDAWDFLHRSHAENMAALGADAKPRAHFDALRRLPPAMRRLSVAMDEGRPVAALLLLYGGGAVEYVTPTVDVAQRARQPLSFLIWRGMEDAIARGYRDWNWGGTWATQHSLHHFKAGFAARDRPYSYLVLASRQGVETLRIHRSALGALFPYFYVYPYALLTDRG